MLQIDQLNLFILRSVQFLQMWLVEPKQRQYPTFLLFLQQQCKPQWHTDLLVGLQGTDLTTQQIDLLVVEERVNGDLGGHLCEELELLDFEVVVCMKHFLIQGQKVVLLLSFCLSYSANFIVNFLYKQRIKIIQLKERILRKLKLLYK